MPILSQNPPPPPGPPPDRGRFQITSRSHHSVTPPASVGVSSSLFARPLRTHVLITPCSTRSAKLFPMPLLSPPPCNIYLEEVAFIPGVEKSFLFYHSFPVLVTASALSGRSP